jgi:hypothetical protein
VRDKRRGRERKRKRGGREKERKGGVYCISSFPIYSFVAGPIVYCAREREREREEGERECVCCERRET